MLFSPIDGLDIICHFILYYFRNLNQSYFNSYLYYFVGVKISVDDNYTWLDSLGFFF